MNFQEFLEHSKLDSKDYQREGVEWCIGREQSALEQSAIEQSALEQSILRRGYRGG